MVIALASHDMRNNHPSQRDDCGLYHAVLLRHKFRSLRHVRAQLRAADHANLVAATNAATAADDQTTRDALLLVIMLHGLLEIANNSTKEWVVHLQGALSTARHYRATYGAAAFSREVLEFASNCFAQQETLAATASRAVLGGSGGVRSETGAWRSEICCPAPDLAPTTVHDRFRINGYTGVSTELLNIIASITAAIGDKRRRCCEAQRRPSAECPLLPPTSGTGPPPTGDFEAAVRAIQNRLQQLRQWSDEPDPDSPANLNSAALQEATWVYLRHGLRGEPVESMAIQTDHLPRLLRLLQKVHQKRIHPVGSTPYPMWALFVAACVAQEDNRAQVLDWFGELRRHRPFSNVPVTMAAVEAIWKKVDLERGGIQWAASGKPDREQSEELIWEGAIHRLGWTMAFI
ncbi:hypothetical protein SPI_02654 [Niveomyces insectorum RCEF 264]|uniref:Uncharacterized protein n=1 Tax=Niveomyces insectorum RCEF 264 TaxID=1081102 RepID=A0A167Y5I4_9HYPO|nr:hypothetical protein SPI_02654 [Niveomyces insectorum RCEF 264]